MDAKELRKEIALWTIRLNTDDVNERHQAEIDFEVWKNQHPEYGDQLDHMLSFAEKMQQLTITHGISSQNIHQSIEANEKSIRNIQQIFNKILLVCLTVGGIGYTLHSSVILSYYTADYKTDTGEIKSFILEDGSKITLGAKSAIKLDFKQTKRQINLIQGDVYIDVARDPSRPLIVQTSQANFKALGTRFIVNQYISSSTLSVLHSKVETNSLYKNTEVKIIQQGEKVIANSLGLSRISELNIRSTEMAWQKYQILADNLPLSDLLTRLSYHHHEYLLFSHSTLNKYKISGVINARQDINQTLDLLVSQHPQLKIKRMGSQIISIIENK